MPHERLKSKLRSCEISGSTLKWISSFLQDRKQRVQVSGEVSERVPVEFGVMQGTVLGPLLFLFYINDITDNITSEIRLCRRLYHIEENRRWRWLLPVTARSELPGRLGIYVADEIQLCQMSHDTHFIAKKSAFQLQVCDELINQLENVKSYPYLGVEISTDLRWNVQVNKAVKKASESLGMLRRNIAACSR